MDFDPAQVTRGDASIISEYVRVAAVQSGKWAVVERAQIRHVLAEQSLELTGCTDQTCAVKVGRLLNAQYIVAGTFGDIAGTHSMTARLVDVQTGAVIRAASEKGFGLAEVDIAAAQLIQQLGGASGTLWTASLGWGMFEGKILSIVRDPASVQREQTTYCKRWKMRVENGNIDDGYLLIDTEKGSSLIIQPGAKAAFEVRKGFTDHKESILVGRPTGKTETIAGLTSALWLAEDPASHDAIEIWLTKGLGPVSELFVNAWKYNIRVGSPGLYPVKYAVHGRGQTAIKAEMETVAIEDRHLEDSLFEVPEGYHLADMPK